MPASSEAFDLEGLIREVALSLYGTLSIEAAQMADKDAEWTESACHQRIENAERAIETAQAAAHDMTIRSEERQQQIDSLKSREDVHLARIDTLTAQHNDAEKSLIAANSEHSRTTSELSAEIVKLQEAISVAKEDPETHQALLKRQETASSEAMARLNKTIEEERQSNAEYATQLSALQAERSTLEHSLAELNAAMNQLRESANVFESQAHTALVRVNEIQQENSLVY